ncbi:MAG: tRNA glutamyl-Q(34) synthetase GluQRS [Coriobacteriaceae bacterium]|nr:tRNA glutamyl-Q(34) synthetase GluQRS [Coriobacteriaceae bacterium]
MAGRFAPTPSGRMQFGNVYSAVLAYASARSHDGAFFLRFEDLDERTRETAAREQLTDDLRWLGITWDADPLIQSGRSEVYERSLAQVSAAGEVYPCFCTRSEIRAAIAPHGSDGIYVYPLTCYGLSPDEVAERAKTERYSLRLHVPDRDISFTDGCRGPYTANLARESGDFILQRSDGIIAYHLACVTDDAASGIDEVVRGADLIPSTPQQIYLQQLLGYTSPAYFHHPVLYAPDGHRLSKRHRDCDFGRLKDRFETPEALLGRVAALSGIADAPLSIDEFIGAFSWDKVPTSDIVVDPATLADLGRRD